MDVVLCAQGEQARVLRDGRADVALLHRPFDDTADFDTENLHTEVRLRSSSGGHPVRLKAGVAVSALYEPFPGLKVGVPASELRNQPVVLRNDLFELPVRLNGRLALECAPVGASQTPRRTKPVSPRASHGMPSGGMCR